VSRDSLSSHSSSSLTLILPFSSFLPSSNISLSHYQHPPPVDLIMPPASLVLNITTSFSVQFYVFRPNSEKVEISTNLGFWDSFSTFNGRPNLPIFLFWNFLLFQSLYFLKFWNLFIVKDCLNEKHKSLCFNTSVFGILKRNFFLSFYYKFLLFLYG
jgi:hypothetical protein